MKFAFLPMCPGRMALLCPRSVVYNRMADWRRNRTELPVSYDALAQNRAIIGTPDQ